MKFVESRLIEEEQWMNSLTADSTEIFAVLDDIPASNCGIHFIPTCTYCKNCGHLESAFKTKYSHRKLDPNVIIMKSETSATNEVDALMCLAATAPFLFALTSYCLIDCSP